MLKALDELERAVSRLEEKARGKSSGKSVPGHGEKTAEITLSGRFDPYKDEAREEAAELIRRAIRRLRSL